MAKSSSKTTDDQVQSDQTPEVSSTKNQAESSEQLQAPDGYELVDWTFGPRIVTNKFGTIDLRKLTPQRAEQLVRMKFKYLKRKS